MKFIRDQHDKIAPLFEKGGKLEKLYPAWEAHDTLLFTPGEVTKGTTHVRDALDLKRMMITVVVALVPCVFMALYNPGYQANAAIAMGASPLDSFQTTAFEMLGFTPGATDMVSHLVYGGLHFLPIFITAFATGGLIEMAFALIRGHEINEGFLVTGFLFPLTLPPTIPLWQVAMGIAFGVIIGKEVFGGTGMNVLNPALTGRAFLFFAYPAQISGEAPWLAADLTTLPDGQSGATWLARFSADAAELGNAGAVYGAEWMDAFVGFTHGSMGETSVIACLIGASILIATKIGSWRTMAGVIAGTFVMSTFLNMVGSDTNPMFHVPFAWHAVLGGWAFGLVFMATDPVSSAFTDKGKLIYGFCIGIMVILVRVINPAYPEGMMLAILFMNMFAPFIDHWFVQANIKRRIARRE